MHCVYEKLDLLHIGERNVKGTVFSPQTLQNTQCPIKTKSEIISRLTLWAAQRHHIHAFMNALENYVRVSVFNSSISLLCMFRNRVMALYSEESLEMKTVRPSGFRRTLMVIKKPFELSDTTVHLSVNHLNSFLRSQEECFFIYNANAKKRR